MNLKTAQSQTWSSKQIESQIKNHILLSSRKRKDDLREKGKGCIHIRRAKRREREVEKLVNPRQKNDRNNGREKRGVENRCSAQALYKLNFFQQILGSMKEKMEYMQ